MSQLSQYIFIHIVCRNSLIIKKDSSSFLFVGVAILVYFSIKGGSGDIPSFEMVLPKMIFYYYCLCILFHLLSFPNLFKMMSVFFFNSFS